ncbi:MAG: WYL domain-containing protein [Deltaproteobacteria bacterium]|nr:WYL domain-containing protein [Deltaproteobacteria bacterium]
MDRGDLQIQDLRVILLLANARAPMTTRQISDKLGIELRTVQRIIKVLEEIPLPIRRDKPGMGGGIKLLGDYSLKVSLPSNVIEVAALVVARESMRERGDGTMIGEAFEQLCDRFLQQLKGEQRSICDKFTKLYQGKPSVRPANANPIARMAHKALDEHRVLAIEYVSPGEQRPKRRDIEPFGVWVGGKRTYLVGRDRAKDALRTFALDRIRWASVSETRFAPESDFDPADYFKHAIDAFVGDGPVDLELALDAEAVRRLGERLPSRDAKLVRTPDGGGVLHWNVPLSDELVAWTFALGPGVSVQAPAEAKAFVRERLAMRLAAQPATKAAKKPRAKKPKPTALPGPLMRRMLPKR